MKLLAFETSRVVFLTQLHRPIGQLYFPEAIAKIERRYAFIKSPSPDQVLPFTFGIGKFKETQISELGIYNDGFIVSSASDTDLLDAFIQDLLEWATKEFGLVPLDAEKVERFYESSIIVKSTSNLSAVVTPKHDLSAVLGGAMRAAKVQAPLSLSGFILDFDPSDFIGKRKPFRFIVDRRVGLPFSENTFFSQGPFRTKDHLQILRSLEKLAKSSLH